MTEDKKDKNKLVFFRNYDLYDTPEKGGPGTGLYSGKYKSVEEFRNRKKKQKKKQKKRAFLLKMLLKLANKDINKITDPTNDTTTPIPYPPAEVSPIGMLDGIYPKSDLEGNQTSNLYYGIMETHMAEDGSTDDDEASQNERQEAYFLGFEHGKYDLENDQVGDILASFNATSKVAGHPDEEIWIAYTQGYADGSQMTKEQLSPEIKRMMDHYGYLERSM
jgi:hypothetical protein